MRRMQLLLVAGAVLGTSGALAKPEQKSGKKPAIEPRADQLLRKLSTDLAALKRFEVETRQVLEVVTKEGEKLQGLSASTVHAQRPNKLRADRMGPLGGGIVYYDGKSLSVYGRRDNLYATSPAPYN